MNRSSLLVALTLLLVPPAAAAQNVPEVPVIVTTGQAEVKKAPDRAWVAINAESRSKDPKEAQRLNAAAMTAVTEKLKGMNLGADAIRTTAYELHPEFDYANNRQTLRGYVARNAIEVRVDEITRVGDVLGAAVGSGATSVGGLRFDIRDRAAAEREALRLAVQDARARADAAAAGAGVQVVRVQRVEEQRMFEPGPRPMMRGVAEQSMAVDVAPPITPGTIEIRSTVTMTVAVR
ncbi:MAG: SIMPL domain-containing protein [Acidobacteriota bacterium]|nr:SIMPL domain-containing protein [Acidobacteriota bacterium]MDQ3418564.1 SIMPL domain-containing protein [Acidobacteriota bacterium]